MKSTHLFAFPLLVQAALTSCISDSGEKIDLGSLDHTGTQYQREIRIKNDYKVPWSLILDPKNESDRSGSQFTIEIGNGGSTDIRVSVQKAGHPPNYTLLTPGEKSLLFRGSIGQWKEEYFHIQVKPNGDENSVLRIKVTPESPFTPKESAIVSIQLSRPTDGP